MGRKIRLVSSRLSIAKELINDRKYIFLMFGFFKNWKYLRIKITSSRNERGVSRPDVDQSTNEFESTRIRMAKTDPQLDFATFPSRKTTAREEQIMEIAKVVKYGSLVKK
jgi:hypothetical protein